MNSSSSFSSDRLDGKANAARSQHETYSAWQEPEQPSDDSSGATDDMLRLLKQTKLSRRNGGRDDSDVSDTMKSMLKLLKETKLSREMRSFSGPTQGNTTPEDVGLSEDQSSRGPSPMNWFRQESMPALDGEESEEDAADVARPFDDQDYRYEGMFDVAGDDRDNDNGNDGLEGREVEIPNGWGGFFNFRGGLPILTLSDHRAIQDGPFSDGSRLKIHQTYEGSRVDRHQLD